MAAIAKLMFCQSFLLPIVLVLSGDCAGNSISPEINTVDVPIEHRTACGPIACYVALKTLNVQSVSFKEIVRLCNWSEGELTSLRTIRDVLDNTYGIRCSAYRMSPAELMVIASDQNAVALIPIRKFSDRVDHIVSVAGTSNGELQYWDYPEALVTIPLSDLREIWEGEVLLAERSGFEELLSNWSLLVIPTIAILALMWRKARLPMSASAMLLLLGATVRADEPITPHGFNCDSIDFGLVLPGSDNEASFVFTNTSSEPVSLSRAHISCGCVSVFGLPAMIEARQSKKLAVGLKASIKPGPVNQNITVSVQGEQKNIAIRCVVQGIWTDQNTLDLGDFPVSSELKITKETMVYVASAENRPEITLKFSGDGLSGKLEPRVVPRAVLRRRFGIDNIDVYRLAISVSPQSIPSNLYGDTTAQVWLESDKFKPVQVGVRYSVTGMFAASPSRLNFGRLSAKAESREFQLVNTSKKDKIDEFADPSSLSAKVEPDYDFLSVSILKDGWVKITADPEKARKGFFSGRIVVSENEGAAVLCSAFFVGVVSVPANK